MLAVSRMSAAEQALHATRYGRYPACCLACPRAPPLPSSRHVPPPRPHVGVLLGWERDPAYGGQKATVLQVIPNSAAEQAGLCVGDQLLWWGIERISGPAMWDDKLEQLRIGDDVALKVLHQGFARNAVLCITGVDADALGPQEHASAPALHMPADPSFLLADPELKLFFGVAVHWQRSDAAGEQAAVVYQVMPESPAALAGLARGDLILLWDADRVSGPSMWNQKMQQLRIGDEVALHVMRRGVAHDLRFRAGGIPATELEQHCRALSSPSPTFD